MHKRCNAEYHTKHKLSLVARQSQESKSVCNYGTPRNAAFLNTIFKKAITTVYVFNHF